ncbi:MAG TPA: hypothetical protein VFH38_00885 [Jatrophihabitans sp.]|nr:hypothetical protein [Jatrophihabitans sp.]
MNSADWLIAGPRGRRLCSALNGEGLERAGAEQLFAALADAVTWATYWQEPDDVDQALAAARADPALHELAARVAAQVPAWWNSNVDLTAQVCIEWDDPALAAPAFAGVPQRVAAWRAGEAADERRAAERPPDVRAPWSGHWWSAPCLQNLPSSARTVGAEPVGLTLVEDELGWTAALCRPVVPSRDVRIYEIRSADDWIRLVERHPFDVSLSRRHDWWRATGLDSRWLIPDYTAVGRDYDGVHLTVRAYLEAAGRALPVGKAHTVLAGWHPDQTYWLTDCLAVSGPAQRWVRDENADPCRWHPGDDVSPAAGR